MNILSAIVLTVSSTRAAAFLSEAAGKSFLILTAAFILALICRRSAAATRHFIWFVAVAGLLALPVAEAFAPHWSGPGWANALLQQRFSGISGNDVPALSVDGGQDSVGVESSKTAASSASTVQTHQAVRHYSLRKLAWRAWLAGVCMTLLFFLRQRWLLHQIERNARPVTEPEVRDLWNSALGELRLNRNVRLLQNDEPLMPMVWGWWRPAALLPSEALLWERSRLHSVLRHELAHVRRDDCLAQSLAALVCALYWFNPLAWLAAARMRAERERACDDLVLSLGETRPSEYAGHLLEIARHWSAAPRGALPVAKRSGLERRLRALLDGAISHGEMSRRAAAVVVCALAAGLLALAGWKAAAGETPDPLRQELIARLQTFSQLKEKQAEQLAADAGVQITPQFKDFFDAAIRGDGPSVTNKEAYFMQNHRQYSHTNANDVSVDTPYWQTVLEICLGYEIVVPGEAKYIQEYEEGIVQSIPSGAIYFGGTDPGRGLITAFCRSQPDADPFFTLTQNALADTTYLEYLRRMYGGRISVPTGEEAESVFSNYLVDAKQRLAANQLKPGEDVHLENGHVAVSGQVAVMQINGGIARIIFAHNPDRDFYIEESFPLDWMFPYLEPHGLILKINRTALPSLSADAVQRDEDYWQPRIQEMIGDWLRPETPLADVLDFADRVFGRGDFSGFTGDARFVKDTESPRMFSKLRSSIAGVYAWRVGALKEIPTPSEYLAPTGAESERMSAAADFAFRQALALCPYSPEVNLRYANFLTSQGRTDDANAVLQIGQRLEPLAKAIQRK
jgi:beta-lactamase regulating signal transducer with metallopeptidase domain